MQAENEIFLFSEADRQLWDSQHPSAPYHVTPEVIDREMGQNRSWTHLHIYGITQEGLEHFAAHAGKVCRVLWLDDCRKIRDFTPLAGMKCLEALRISYCRNIGTRGDLSANPALRVLSIDMARKLCEDPAYLCSSATLEEVRFWGSFDNRYPMRSLDCFRGMTSLRRIDLNGIRLTDHSLEALSTLPNLEQFHFDAGMLTAAEKAEIRIAYPHLWGESLMVAAK